MCEQYTAQPLRLCKGCGDSFPATTEWFYFNKGYLGRKCKTCRAAQIEVARLIRTQPVTGLVIVIACQTCGRDFDWIRKASRQPIHCSRACKDRSGYVRRRDKIIAYQVAYRAEHREYINARQLVYGQKHAEQIKAKLKRYYDEHREKWVEWRRANPERAVALARQWYEANRERASETNRAWRQAHPDRQRDYNRKKDAIRRGARVAGIVRYSLILRRDRWICGLCGKKVESRKELHFDHITPLSKQGAHAEWNVQVSHKLCNLRKGNKLIGQPRLPL